MTSLASTKRSIRHADDASCISCPARWPAAEETHLPRTALHIQVGVQFAPHHFWVWKNNECKTKMQNNSWNMKISLGRQRTLTMPLP